MKRLLGLTAVLLLVMVSGAFAQEHGPGCGPGKKLFEGQRGKMPHLLAATTNAILNIWGVQTFAISSGTSGCDSDSVVKVEYEQKVFVAANLDPLSEDMAEGGGQYLQALSGLMGCATGDYAAFAELTQARFESLASDSPEVLLSGLKRELSAHPTLGQSCTRLS